MRSKWARLGWVLLTALVFAQAGEAIAQEQTCVTCHRRRTSDHLRAPLAALSDVHGEHDVRCSSCHGGRPDLLSMQAHDPGAGFSAGSHGFAQVAMCGGCHDGSVDGLDDVLTRYRAGSHMRAVTDGKPGARCSDCHGAHGVAPPDDPESPASRAKVPYTCGSCHAAMGPGIPSDQLFQWESSVHGRSYAGGGEEAPTCAGCHDPHENNAGLSAVTRCGECHEEVRAAFDSGPHAEHFRRYGFLDCAECHGSHEVRSPDATLLTGRSAACNRCHGRGQAAFDKMREVAALVMGADRNRRALPPTDERRKAFIAAIHALDLEAIRTAADAMPEAPPDGEAEPDEDLALHPIPRWSGLVYGMAAVILATLVFAFFLLRRTRR